MSETSKILSIDFTCIMYPCIKLYHSMIPMEQTNEFRLWEAIDHQLEIDKFLTYDAKVLKKITSILKNQVLKDTKFIPVEKGTDVVSLIETNENLKDKKIDLYHVGFYHNFIYDEKDIQNIIDFGKYNLSNWIGYLYMNDFLNSFHWVKSSNSDQINPDLSKNVDLSKVNILMQEETGMIQKEKMDYSFFIASPQWVPYKYKILYDLIVYLLKDGDVE